MAQPYILSPAQGSGHADEWVRLALEAQTTGKFPDAERHYRQALRLEPHHAIATQNFAILYAQVNNLNEALLTIERASLFDGTHGIIYTNWALMALEAERMDVALTAARKAVEVAPTPEARLALAMVLAAAGLPEEAIPQYNEILKVQPQHPAAGPNSCFVMTLTSATPETMLAQRKKWYEANRLHGAPVIHSNDKSLTRPLRVGYVGGDFKRHSAAMIFGAVVLHHDPARVETYLYSTLPVDPAADTVTKQFMDVAGANWRNLVGTNPAQAGELVRQDKIDILVDLAAHTNGGMLTLFTGKPAPIQVTAWGFAHGTGLPEIDYFFADPVAIPQEEREHYAETIWDLPCIVTYEPPVDYNLKGTSPLPYFKHDAITFGSYARYEKLSNDYLRCCHQILQQVPDSRLEFKDHAFRRPYSIRRIREAMPDIAQERLLFSIGTTHQEHLLTYHQADLILDPFPHTGGVVCLEQLFMSVPIVTLYGTQPAGRTTSSVLTAMGRTEWIAKTTDQYIEIAVSLSKDITTLNKVRKTLRNEFLASPVISGYVEKVEASYKEMWAIWVNQ